MNNKTNNKRVLSGIRPTSRLHIGNYLGAVKGMLVLQDDPSYETLYMVADLHTLTTPYNKDELSMHKRAIIMDYLAAGLDPEKSVLFIQSMVPYHTELAFYFSSVVTIARMQHLPTFKEKVKQYPESVTMALLNYPVLMAADILMYKANEVPVGTDQDAHLEVSREIARKMNDRYDMDFPEPKRFVTKGEYVPSLLGKGKMAKSVEGSYINISDDLETIKSRLAKVPTDEGKGRVVPHEGSVANLLVLVELFQGEEKRKEYEKSYTTKGLRYKELKEDLADAIYSEVLPLQEKRHELESNGQYVDEVIEEGKKKASLIAKETIVEVKQKMGLC